MPVRRALSSGSYVAHDHIIIIIDHKAMQASALPIALSLSPGVFPPEGEQSKANAM